MDTLKILKIASPLLILFFSFCAPSPSTENLDSEVQQIANLISREEVEVDHFDLTKPQRGVEGEAPTALPVEGATRAPIIDLARHIVSLSRHYDLDPLLVLAMIKVESQFQPDARSHAGAIGLMQVTPIVMREAGSIVSVDTREDLYNPYKNLRLGIYYFNHLLEKYRNNLPKALAAYNMGPTALDTLMSEEEAVVPLLYYERIMRCYQSFKKKAFLHSPETI